MGEDLEAVPGAQVVHAVEGADVDDGELRARVRGVSAAITPRRPRTRRSLTATWFETMQPGPNWTQRYSVWAVSKLLRPRCRILPALRRLRRCWKAVTKLRSRYSFQKNLERRCGADACKVRPGRDREELR